MITDLRSSGFFKMELENYESASLYKKGILYHEGKRPKYLYFLNSGKIKAFRLHEDGKEYITNLYSSGDFIGYMSLLENKSYEDTAEVIENAEVLMIPMEEFTGLIYNDLGIAAKFISLIVQNVREKEERLLNLAYGSLRKRVAKALVDIHEKFNGKDNPGQALDVSREDIAQYVGTATESLIRTLSDFKAEKLIEIKDGKTRIIDLPKLKHLLY
jgi:CRP-like cAMP-binding protein